MFVKCTNGDMVRVTVNNLRYTRSTAVATYRKWCIYVNINQLRTLTPDRETAPYEHQDGGFPPKIIEYFDTFTELVAAWNKLVKQINLEEFVPVS